MEGHHAWVGTGTTIAAAQAAAIDVHDIDTETIEQQSLSIDDVRRLKTTAATRPVIRPYRLFVIVVAQLPVLSQNALLKLFEDPPMSSKFLLIVPDVDILIPTLRSRVMLLDISVDECVSPQSFLQLSYEERLQRIARWATDGDITAMQEVLAELEHSVAGRVAEHTMFIEALMYVRAMFAEPGASKKMLLEHLALLAPTSP